MPASDRAVDKTTNLGGEPSRHLLALRETGLSADIGGRAQRPPLTVHREQNSLHRRKEPPRSSLSLSETVKIQA